MATPEPEQTEEPEKKSPKNQTVKIKPVTETETVKMAETEKVDSNG